MFANKVIELSNHMINHKRIAWFLFLIALAIRLLFAVYSFRNEAYLNLVDDLAYFDYGKNVLSQGIFVPDLEELGLTPSVVGPGIGWIMGLIFLLFGESWLNIFVFSAIISAFITLFTYKLSDRLFGKSVAFWASLWSILFIAFIKPVPTCGKDLLMTLLFLMVVYYSSVLLSKSFKHYKVFILGLLYFLLIHTDERFLIFGPMIFVFLIFANKKSFKNGLLQALIFTVITGAFSLPWLIRNYQVYDRIILISVRTAPYTEKIFGYDHVEYFEIPENRNYISPAQIDSIVSGILQPNTDGEIILKNLKHENRPLIVRSQYIDALKKGYYPHEFTKTEKIKANFTNFWEPVDMIYDFNRDGYRFDGKWSMKHNLMIGFTYGLLLPFFIFGLILLLIRKPLWGASLLIIILSYSMLHVLLIDFTNERYRIPLEPFIIIIAFYAMVNFGNIFLKKMNK